MDGAATSRFLYIDASAGVSGNMLLAALLDVGVPRPAVEEAIQSVVTAAGQGTSGSATPPAIGLNHSVVLRAGLRARHIEIVASLDQPHRGLSVIEALLEQAAGLPDPVKHMACGVFGRLAVAEAATHAIPVDEVRFHEVGALDAIADIVGVCAGVNFLRSRDPSTEMRITGSRLGIGSGEVRAEHGVLPVPVPAVTQLLTAAARGRVPVTTVGIAGHEACTPTGLALLLELVDDFGPVPDGRLEAVGVGAGSRDFPGRANVVRMLYGTSAAAGSETIVEVACNVDDADPRIWSYVIDRLLAGGARDAWVEPIWMKKQRPGAQLRALCDADQVATMWEIVRRETPTLGIRVTPVQRLTSQRDSTTVTVAGHPVRVKRGWSGAIGQSPIDTVQAEFEDAVAVARATGTPVREVIEEANRLAALPDGGVA